MPNPSPIIMPSELVSNVRTLSLLEKAGVLLKHKYIKIELSVSTPPEIIMSERCSVNSLIAKRMALRELAQAASTTQLIPPKLKRFATRPAMTLPSMPGKEFSSQRMYAIFILSTIGSISLSLKPLLFNTLRHTGYCKRHVKGVINFCPPPTPKTTPVRFRIS